MRVVTNVRFVNDKLVKSTAIVQVLQPAVFRLDEDVFEVTTGGASFDSDGCAIAEDATSPEISFVTGINAPA
jgi:hypothetical protein